MSKANRYIRQTLLDAIGHEGQHQLMQSHVAVVGCGGLGSIAAPYLAGAGVGHITLIDGDSPDITNLHRQVLYTTDGPQATKASLLAEHIAKLNPDIRVTVHESMLTKMNISELLAGIDIVLECTDHILTKYLVNDYCHLHRTPMIYGAMYKYDGYASVFENISAESIHLRDIYAQPNTDIPTCSEVGVMGTLAGLIGIMQANEAIKYITGAGSTLVGTYLSYSCLTNEQMKLRLIKTYSDDLELVYSTNSYREESGCSPYELAAETVLADLSKYTVISVLPDEEHVAIADTVLRQPMVTIDYETWQSADDKPVVFYCKSGKRSLQVVERLRRVQGSRAVYSLAGGVQGLPHQPK